jgi:lipoate-protein ligase A
MKFLSIKNKSIYFYLALEEYLLKNFNDEFFMLWQTNNVLVCGKHQNIYEEINILFVTQNKIKIARRLSGGGTVYQDKGNINFTFIFNKEKGKQIDFKLHTKSIYEFLKTLNIDVHYNEHNNLFIDNNKISGNAEHVYKNRVLHHGTLLYNSNLINLENSIKNELKIESKAIKSIKKDVTNLLYHLKTSSITKFTNNLQNFVKNSYSINEEFTLTKTDLENINLSIKNKYNNKNWIYNYSPKFKIFSNLKIGSNIIYFEIYVENGIITKIDTENIQLKMLKDAFLQKKYDIITIKNIILANKINEQLNTQLENILNSFFSKNEHI